MGTVLCVGICRKFSISKEDMNRKKFSLDDIEKALSADFDLDMFVRSEDERAIRWKLKDEFLCGSDLVKFLKSQYELYDESEDYSQYYDTIGTVNGYEALEELANEQSGPHFQKLDGYCFEHLKVSRFESIMVYYNLFAFIAVGKIFMEQYSLMMRYFERLIRNSHAQHPVAKAVKVLISK